MKNIWNADEFSIFYQMLPRGTIAPARIPGRKKKKERTTCLACYNATFLVGKSENPRCFNGKTSSELHICYSSSHPAWMNFSLFLRG